MWPVDWIHLAYCSFGLVFVALNVDGVEHAERWLALDAAALIGLLCLLRVSRGVTVRRATLLRFVYSYLFVPFAFLQTGFMVTAVAGHDYAAELERLDRALFWGANPLEALEAVASPLLTEILHWVYVSYWFLPAAALTLILKKGTPKQAARFLFAVVAAFYISYAGYALVPASGPNIHNNFGPLYPTHVEPLALYTFDTNLPGFWAADRLKQFVYAGEPTKFTSFPSGHVLITLVSVFWALRCGGRCARLLLAVGSAIIFSTVYLRYHYVVDVLASIVLAGLCVTAGERIHRLWELRRARRPLRPRPAAA